MASVYTITIIPYQTYTIYLYLKNCGTVNCNSIQRETGQNWSFSAGIQMTSLLVEDWLFTCLCPFVPSKINSSAAPELRNYRDMGTDTTWYQTQFTACCLTKDKMYESYSPWKGHCFAQLPSAGAACGVETQIDKSEMTLKQRQEGHRLFVCPLDKVGVEETQSRVGWVTCTFLITEVKWLNKEEQSESKLSKRLMKIWL